MAAGLRAYFQKARGGQARFVRVLLKVVGKIGGVDISVHLPMRGESGNAKLISFFSHRPGGQKGPPPLLVPHAAAHLFQLHPPSAAARSSQVREHRLHVVVVLELVEQRFNFLHLFFR